MVIILSSSYRDKIRDLRSTAQETQAAIKIRDKLTDLRSKDVLISSYRWIWELIQNAKDCPNSSGKIDIEILFDSTRRIVEFKHNGKLFSTKNIVYLIEQVSTKERTRDSENTGKFGTGFLTTNLLSPIVKISGLLHDDDDDNIASFEVTLDRSGNTIDELKESIKNSCNQLESNTSIIFYPITGNGMNTSFSYLLDDNGMVAAKNGLDNFLITAPYVFAFVPELNQITINNNGETSVYTRTQEGDTHSENVFVSRIRRNSEATPINILTRALLDDLYVKSQKYALIVNNSDEEHSYTSALLDLDRISGAPSYLLLLYLLSNQEKLKLTDDNIHQVVKLLIVFFVRRSVTDVPNTRKLTQLFIDIISEIKIHQGDAIVSYIRKTFKSVAATDEEFEAKLRGSLYEENPEAVRFILCSIEAEHQTKEIYSDLWSRDRSNKYIWTIEHIFPEGQNIPDSWVDMIANGDKELAKQYLSEYVHTLGNLTITGYNQNLSNMSFDKKKDRKSKDKSKDIGYKNGLFLNQDVVTEDVWTIDKIKNRTNKIVGILIEMYKW